MATTAFRASKDPAKASPGTWSWIKEWSGYVVTVLPYVSAGLVLIPGLAVWAKAVILFIFAAIVLYIRVWHEKAGVEVTAKDQRQKRPD
jgi:hypothetical protein